MSGGKGAERERGSRPAEGEGAASETPAFKVAVAGKCPICDKPRVADYRPFCSKRCADIDLSRWLSEAYTVPGEASDEAEETPSGTADHGE